MLGATPPRRISRSSTRKDTESLSSCSTTRESANLPPNVIRWSVAMEPAMRSEPDDCVGTARKTTDRYGCGYALVANTVKHMTPNPDRLAYDDAASMAEMRADCEAVGRNLGFERRLARAAEAATEPAPSIHF